MFCITKTRYFICSLIFLSVLTLWNCTFASEPKIVGSKRFTDQVHEAVLLLKERDVDAYTIVTNSVSYTHLTLPTNREV